MGFKQIRDFVLDIFDPKVTVSDSYDNGYGDCLYFRYNSRRKPCWGETHQYEVYDEECDNWGLKTYCQGHWEDYTKEESK